MWVNSRFHQVNYGKPSPVHGSHNVRQIDYTPDIRKRIQLTPPPNIVDVWAKDYQEMQESMIYGDSLPFNKLLERIHILENRFHNVEKQN